VRPALDPALRPLLAAPDALIDETSCRLGNPGWDEAEARVLIVRLSPWKDVDRSTGHLVLFSECRASLPGAYLDFAFFPERQDRELLVERGLPFFYGLASGRSPADFDLVMVSLSFSLELLNLPYLFSTSDIPFRSSERSAARAGDRRSPLFILGGSGAACAASLLAEGGGSMMDGLFFGEGEGAIGELAATLSDRRLPAVERLERAAAVEGFWLPGAGPCPGRRLARPLPPPLLSYPVLNSPESSTARLQITAGCPGLCSFCLEGWDRRPYRERPLSELLAAARELRRESGADSLEVYSFNFNTHASVFALLFELNRIFRRVNFMSQRVDGLAGSPLLARAEMAADKRSFTLGVEGISRRIRAYYRKGLTDEDIEGAIDALLAKGVRELKLFYIVSGLEGEGDLAEFAAFTSRLGELRRERAPGLRLLASAGFLVRLPSTPLQFAPLALDEAPLARIAGAMRASCEAAGIEFRLASHFDEYCADQLLSLGGPGLLPWLEALPAEGHCYEGSLSRSAWPSLRSFAESAGILDAAFLGEKPASWRPAIDFGDGDILRAHYEEARRFEDRMPCLGGGCAGCGACDEAADRAAIGGHRSEGPADAAFVGRLERLMAAKATFGSVLAEVELPPALAGATPEYASSWLMRELSRASPGVEAFLFGAQEVLFSSGELEGMLPPGFTGKCAFSLAGPAPGRLRAAAAALGLRLLDALPALERASVEVELPTAFSAGAAAAFREWLAEERVAFVESRAEGAAGSGARRISPAAKGERKRVLYGALLEEGPRFRARLELGPKARLPGWLDRLGPRASAAARVTVLSLSR
jgi:hypothetical protein